LAGEFARYATIADIISRAFVGNKKNVFFALKNPPDDYILAGTV
jgi:hypothetical protein